MRLTNEKLIIRNKECKTPEEAIRAAGHALFENNYVEKRYIGSMINNYIENGSYFVLAPGLAMPHARPEDGVLKAGISVVTLKDPLEFGSEANDPVRVVLGLAAKDDDEHILFMSEVAKLLSKEGIVAKLAEAKSEEEIVNLMQE